MCLYMFVYIHMHVYLYINCVFYKKKSWCNHFGKSIVILHHCCVLLYDSPSGTKKLNLQHTFFIGKYFFHLYMQ